ncbi:G patch domain-containing protein TGH [Alnus glutinosa]|uniref:G patch domain-containing protein TGH n=1 Tax=Alnus glutinosa TaxID=3517 RepID=UPI002D7A1974|nr:G patch domain-containing protein TGH [Alnus glutinosa]
MDSDEEDYVFYGTPIEREEEFTSRKKKAVAEASGNLRSLPVWKQEVTDEEGRRRFHGAFTGGFSSGYYNTAGSKEGWAPQSFISSRKNRAEVKQQSILNFLDEDEKSEFEGQSLGTSLQFDTFGFTAAELAHKQAEKEQQQRPSAIPGPVPDEIVLPATESIGVKLLLKMGWRHGHAIKESRANSLYDAHREARKAFLAFSSDDAKAQLADSEPVQGDLEIFTEQHANDDVQSYQNTPVYVLNPKQDLHGLGFDPYKHAPEFREKKRSRTSGKWEPGNRKGYSLKDNLFGFNSGNVAPGFGIGALEELDAEDEDVYASGFDVEDTYIQEVEEPSRLITDSKRKLVAKELGVLPGFRVASNSDYQLERFDAPVVPKDFVPQHKFPGPLETNYKLTGDPPPEVPPPEDNNLKLLIEGVATLVARCGKLFEDLSREKNQSNPLFSFLTGGNGHDHYTRKLWEERQKCSNQRKQQVDGKLSSSMQKMTAESRGKILGEKPLERSTKDSSSSVASSEVIHLQFSLSDTFTKPASFGGVPEVAKPFDDDPAKQERFEQFLKAKYHGGLRTTDSSGASNMSEAARARERLDFEAAAEAIQKGQWGKDSKLSTQHFMEFSATGGMQFTSGGVEQVKDTEAEDLITKKMFPKREEYQWRPSPLLCKRFDLIDPYMGKPPPAPRMRSKMDSLIFTSDSAKATKVEETVAANRDSFPTPQSDAQGISQDIANKEEIEAEVEVENVERPVDLYKAIFSDDSDNEGETTGLNKVEDPEKKIEAATTTLNRLIAGDFLESLGKELGLAVPSDLPSSTSKARVPVGDANILPVKNKPCSTPISGTCVNVDVPHDLEIAQDGRSKKNEPIHGNSDRSFSIRMETGSSGKKFDEVNPEKVVQEDKKAKTHSSRHQNRKKSSSSEDERNRKWSRRDRHRSDSDGDSSSDHRDRYRSRSKGRKKGSSREKSSSSKKHSKHDKRRSRDSPARSRYESDREHGEAKREKRKKRD